MTNGFYFDENEHAYYLDGKRMYGVTNILSNWGKGGLIPWAVGCAVKHLQKHPEDVEGALRAHETIRDDAARKGTDVHALVESLVKEAIMRNKGKIIHPGVQPKQKQLSNFLNWAMGNGITFLKSEFQVYSRAHWYAGTADLLLQKDGKTYIGDMKTGKAVRPEYFYQMAAYRVALEEMEEDAPRVDGAMIIRLGKNGSFEIQERFDYETDKAAFLGILAAFKADQTFVIK